MQISSERRIWNSVAVVKPIGTSLDATVNSILGIKVPSAMILSAFVSEMPLIVIICRFGLNQIKYSRDIRISYTFDGVVSCFEEFLDIPCRYASTSLLVRVVLDIIIPPTAPKGLDRLR